MGILMLKDIISSAPIQIYKNFIIEEQYGFNKLTLKLFVKD